MQVTGEGACWPSVRREFKIASLMLGWGNQGPFSEGSAEGSIQILWMCRSRGSFRPATVSFPEMPRLSMDAQQAWTRLAFQCNSKADGSPQVGVGVGVGGQQPIPEP